MENISPMYKYRTLSISIGFILIVILIFFTTKQRTSFNFADTEFQTFCYDNLEEILQARSLNKQIVVTIINYAYIDLTMHWIYRLTRMGIDNFFVYATDQQSADYFRRHHLSHVCYFDGQIDTKNTSTYALWGSGAFKNINNKKMFLANKILHLNYSVLMSEIDVVWFQDPQKHFEEFTKTYDIISQGLLYATPNDQRNIGFFYLSSRNATIQVMNEIEEILMKNPSSWDQTVFNEVVDRAAGKRQVKDLILNVINYPFENFFLDLTIPIDENIIAAHLVGLNSAAHKTFVIKERALSEDVIGYLSYPRKYLTYQNPSLDPNLQAELLRKAVYLSVILNRTLILPRFHCNHIVFYNIFYHLNVPSDCTAERFVDIEHLISHYSIRENSFLRNPRVPKHIRTDYVSYEKTCDSNQHKNNMASILDVGDLNCFLSPDENITVHTCPPWELYGSVLGYGPICK